MVDVIVSQVATEVLAAAIGTTGRRLATAARAPRGRKAEDLGIARWFETHKLTADVPEPPGPVDTERLAQVLRGPAIQAALQELLAARLTDAPETDAARVRETFRLTLTLALPEASSFAPALAGFYDDQICALVARLEAGDPALLPRIRDEALSARMIAVLNAVERHTAALTSAPRDTGTFLANYRHQAVEQHGKIQPPDFDRRRQVPLADIYVPATIYEESSPERSVAPPQPPPSLTVWELAARADRSVLLGDPGGGKTTASNVLMHRLASNPEARVPFLVTLRDFASSDPPQRSVVGHIEHELETFYQCPAPPGLVDTLLLTGRAIVFFDGLDELLDSSRRADVATRVERFCTEYPLAPVLVTSRIVGYDQARLDDRQFTCYRLGGFGDEDVAVYARKWFALEPDAGDGEADAFLTESESVPDLRSNPLLLSLMCILYRGEGSLPRNRAEIYEQCATLLFRRWDARRRIHQDLRAGHLVEQTLRHLAWWLFIRSDTHSAVTERELVTAAAEFLYGRGFESEDEAREAAGEFIEFCHGRMWVFTDTGTTARGEPLYSFTHRTFLEYFAAAQLAYDSDTPEKLARAIAPHVARGEWEIVAELAVQIKDSTSANGAQRIYEKLLGNRQYRSPESRSGVLRFLARTLRSVDPTPQVIRRLTREVIAFLFAGDPNSDTRGLPIAWLLASCGACIAVVDEEISASIAAMVASEDPETHLNGLRLAASLDIPIQGNWGEAGPELPDNNRVLSFWSKRANESVSKYEVEIIAASADHPEIRNIALLHGLISVEQALEAEDDLLPLLQGQRIGVYGVRYVAYLHYQLQLLAGYWWGLSTAEISRYVENLASVGRHLGRHPHPPWVAGGIADLSALRSQEFTPPDGMPPTVDPVAYAGAAAILLISVESTSTLAQDIQDRKSSQLGPFSDLYQYVLRRYALDPETPLPDLPVPEEFKQTFRDWADGKVNFVATPPGPATA